MSAAVFELYETTPEEDLMDLDLLQVQIAETDDNLIPQQANL